MSGITSVTTARPRAASQAGPAPRQAARAAARPTESGAVFLASLRTVAGGGGMSVRERFATLSQRFKPEAAQGVDVRFQFHLSGEGGGDWYVEIKNGKLTCKEGAGPNPTATLTASAKDYKKIADGEMNKTLAFLRGKLDVDGDKGALKKFEDYFEKA